MFCGGYTLQNNPSMLAFVLLLFFGQSISNNGLKLGNAAVTFGAATVKDKLKRFH